MINNDIIKLIVESRRILIIPHILPDGDTIGSSAALQVALTLMDKDAKIIVEDDLPSNLNFLDICELIHVDDLEEDILKFDLVITIDSSDKDRLGKRVRMLDCCDNILNIDHHKTNSLYGSHNLVDENAAACGEIIYSLLEKLNVEINKEIASFLYVALTTDTGSFKYSNTVPGTHRIAASLLETGIDKDYINTKLYQNKPLRNIFLLKDTLNTLEFHYDNRLSIIHVTCDMLEENDVKFSDVDGLIEYARDIEGVEIALLLKEIRNNEIKVGMRSKGNYDVSSIAKAFGGGGHKNAAGCMIFEDISSVKQKLINYIDEEFKVKS